MTVMYVSNRSILQFPKSLYITRNGSNLLVLHEEPIEPLAYLDRQYHSNQNMGQNHTPEIEGSKNQLKVHNSSWKHLGSKLLSQLKQFWSNSNFNNHVCNIGKLTEPVVPFFREGS